MRRLQRGEDEDLAVGADLENGAAAVAHVQVLLAVEGDAGGHAHAFHVDRHVAVGRHLVDDSRRSGWRCRACPAASNARPVAFISSLMNGFMLKLRSIL